MFCKNNNNTFVVYDTIYKINIVSQNMKALFHLFFSDFNNRRKQLAIKKMHLSEILNELKQVQAYLNISLNYVIAITIKLKLNKNMFQMKQKSFMQFFFTKHTDKIPVKMVLPVTDIFANFGEMDD